MIVALAATIVADRWPAIGCIVATNRPSDALYALHMSCWVADYELLMGCYLACDGCLDAAIRAL